MDLSVVEIFVPSGPSTFTEATLLLLRLFMGVCFIRHGWPKLRNLKTWSTAMHTPAWLCFLSAFSMWASGIALLLGLTLLLQGIRRRLGFGFPELPS